ncbi:MAG: hypothetical protein WBD98_17880 [Acidobacteriaceae bacterium]
MEPDAAQQRQQAHMLLDAVPDDRIPAVRDLLETIVDPLALAMAHAQQDREPIAEETPREPAVDPAPRADGDSMLHEAILKEFGLSSEDWEQMGRAAFDAAAHKP